MGKRVEIKGEVYEEDLPEHLKLGVFGKSRVRDMFMVFTTYDPFGIYKESEVGSEKKDD